jgi:pyrimidine-nucleoside phosphorylase/thymidine phosphorylase
MNFLDLIEQKKRGLELSDESIGWLVDSYCAEEIPDYQMSAFLMAVVWRGLSDAEAAALTRAMVGSGERFDLSHLPAPRVDKHSTGGVGDKISLALAPLAAACGCAVPMVSGRGLGHTGGTLDKLESIPGFRTDLDAKTLTRQVEEIGVAMAAQTQELVPADRRLYALRSATATIEDTGLITASILSKKIAEGTDSLVLDVKVGAGAFMPDLEAARELAQRLCSVARLDNLQCRALLTDMDQPLGRAVGNALEVEEAIETLRGEGPPDVEELTVRLAVEMLLVSGLSETVNEAERTVRSRLADGSALAVFGKMVAAQGGNPRVVDDPLIMGRSPETTTLSSPRSGYIQNLHARRVGEAVWQLGAGRQTKEHEIDPHAGLVLEVKCGDNVEKDQPWVTLFHDPGARVEQALKKLADALQVGDEPPSPRPLIWEQTE